MEGTPAELQRRASQKTAAVLKVLFVTNALWDVVFVLSSLYLFYGHTAYIAVILFTTTLLFKELFIYVNDASKNETLKFKWYLKHYNTLTILCAVKFCLLVWFAFMYLVDAADIHILHVLLYLTDEAAFALAILIAIFLAILCLSVYAVPKLQQVVREVVVAEDTAEAAIGGI